MDCSRNEQNARAIALTPVRYDQYRENLRSSPPFADDLERTGEATARHGVDDLTSRFFLKRQPKFEPPCIQGKNRPSVKRGDRTSRYLVAVPTNRAVTHVRSRPLTS